MKKLFIFLIFILLATYSYAGDVTFTSGGGGDFTITGGATSLTGLRFPVSVRHFTKSERRMKILSRFAGNPVSPGLKGPSLSLPADQNRSCKISVSFSKTQAY